MKFIFTAGLLFIFNLMYSQNIQIIKDEDFSYNSKKAIVLFKIRIIDNTNLEY